MPKAWRAGSWRSAAGTASMPDVPAICPDRRGISLPELLAPYADLVISHVHLRAYLGSVESVLAGLAAALDRRDQATDHFEAAVEADRRLGARPHLARTELEYARMLLGGDSVSSSEHRRAQDLLASADETARDLGLTRIRKLAQRIRT